MKGSAYKKLKNLSSYFVLGDAPFKGSFHCFGVSQTCRHHKLIRTTSDQPFNHSFVSSPAQPVPHCGASDARRDRRRQLRPAAVCLRHRGLHERMAGQDPRNDRTLPHRRETGGVAGRPTEVRFVPTASNSHVKGELQYF